jgi:WD40 repeat protein
MVSFMHKFSKKAISIIERLEVVQASIISKAKQIMEVFKLEINFILSQLQSQIKEIENFIIYQNFTDDDIKRFEKNIDVKDKRYNINSFDQIIKKFLRVVIYDQQINPPDPEILDENYKLELKEHTSFVNCIAMTTDYKYLVSGSKDKTVRVWICKRKSKKLF